MTESRSLIALESMSQNAKVSPQAFVESLRQQTEEFLQSVMKTVNDAPDGEWIDGSEEGVRDLAAEFRQRVFQAAVQGRVDAAEAAFSPSAGNNSRPGHETAGDDRRRRSRRAVERAHHRHPRQDELPSGVCVTTLRESKTCDDGSDVHHGVLELNVVADRDQLPRVRRGVRQLAQNDVNLRRKTSTRGRHGWNRRDR